LVLISGIAGEAYGTTELKKHKEVYKALCYKYGEENIIDIDYQPILDRHAFLGDTLLDPLRLLLNPNGWAAERYVAETLAQITTQYDKVDVMTHSLGSWIVLKCKAKINKLILIASPIGFSGILGRHTVRANIWSPKIETLKLHFVYSTNDPVSCFPPQHIEDSKWGCKCGIFKQVNSGTGHGLGDYLEYLWLKERGIILS
jgi:hypothetical protein